jgi:hypothetical protein
MVLIVTDTAPFLYNLFGGGMASPRNWLWWRHPIIGIQVSLLMPNSFLEMTPPPKQAMAGMFGD